MLFVDWSQLISPCSMSDKSELKAELERKKQRIAQIREEKKRKEEEKKKKDVSENVEAPFQCDFVGLINVW